MVGAFDNCTSAEAQVSALNPDIILMDIDMPGRTGIDAVKQIRTFNQAVPIIMLTVFDDSEHVFNAIYSGADGYLLKKHLSDKLIDAIKDILQGGAPMSPAIARMVISGMQQKSNDDYKLTSREKGILALLAQGNSFKMIANDLGLSIDTVKTHSKHIYDKLHVNSQLEAVSKALSERLV